jgi:hypothetical protein
MPVLFDYLEQTRRFMADKRMTLLNEQDLTVYCNRARREVAMRSQSLRVLPPISGSVYPESSSISAVGTGYSNPTLTITPPDFPSGQASFPNGLQATGTISESGGTLTALSITLGGYGYFQPVASITDPTGQGGSVTLGTTFINQTVQGQEVYPFSSISVSSFPGVGSIYAVRSVAILFDNWRFLTMCASFTDYQAQLRVLPTQYEDVPVVCAQFGQGTAGSLYMYPLPSQAYQMEWDCVCLPQDLTTNQSVEALPQPWTDAIPHYMAYLAFQELQNMNSARWHYEQYDMFMRRYSSYARLSRASNQYGRPWWR